MLGDLNDKRVADLGCGTGMLGIGAAILGGKVWELT
jgi:methyltransferase (EC 2.1.1.-)